MNSYTGFQTVTKPKRAVVVGGGFIGLEMVENLSPPRARSDADREGQPGHAPARSGNGAPRGTLHASSTASSSCSNDGVAGFQQAADGSLEVLTSSGMCLPADIVILAIGVRPETALAKMAGLEIGQRGGIRVDDHMRTSDPDIFRRRRRGRS